METQTIDMSSLKALELDINKSHIFYVEVGKMPPRIVKEKVEELRDSVKQAGFTQHNVFATMKNGVKQVDVKELPEIIRQ